MHLSSRRPYINILLSTVCKASENGHLCKISQACYFKEKLWAQWWNKFQGSTKIIENISCQNIEISMNNITRKNSNRKKKRVVATMVKWLQPRERKGRAIWGLAMQEISEKGVIWFIYLVLTKYPPTLWFGIHSCPHATTNEFPCVLHSIFQNLK